MKLRLYCRLKKLPVRPAKAKRAILKFPTVKIEARRIPEAYRDGISMAVRILRIACINHTEGYNLVKLFMPSYTKITHMQSLMIINTYNDTCDISYVATKHAYTLRGFNFLQPS